MQHRQLSEHWDRDLPEFPADPRGMATRESSAKVLNALAKNIPWLIGGSADLAPSTKTRLTFQGAGDFSAENYEGRNFHFGIREHAMGAVLNGMSLVKVRPFGSGFFIFVDYMRGALRLSVLMELPVICVFTHDSIGVGEDGPTHQPIEQLAHMRSMPGLIMIRPADANEVREAWKVILQLHHEPAVLVQFPAERAISPQLNRSTPTRRSSTIREPQKLKPALPSLLTWIAVTILAASSQLPTNSPHCDCSAMKPYPSGTTPSNLNCEVVLEWRLSLTR